MAMNLDKPGGEDILCDESVNPDVKQKLEYSTKTLPQRHASIMHSYHSQEELLHIRRGHAARVTSICNKAETQMRDTRSKATLSKTCEDLEVALNALSHANYRYVTSLESPSVKDSALLWFKQRSGLANEMLLQISEYLTSTKAKSISETSQRPPIADKSELSYKSKQSIINAVKTKQAKLRASQAAESAKLANKIAELQAAVTRQEAKHESEMADLEKQVYQTMLGEEENDDDNQDIDPPAKDGFVQEWLDKHESPLNPHAAVFQPYPPGNGLQAPKCESPGQPIDAWIDSLVIGQETVILQSDSESDSLTHALLRLESERDLPKLHLPTLSGDPIEWPCFVEQFYWQVHTKPGISDTRRMDLLQSHISGEARRLIQGLGYSGRNYALALKELKAAFGHRLKVARAYLNKVVQGQPIPGGDPKALQGFYVSLRDCTTTLQQLQYQSDLYSSDILLKVAKRLPRDKVSRWNEFVGRLAQHREPTLIDLQDWLRDRVEADLNPYAIPCCSESSSRKMIRYEKADRTYTLGQEKRTVRKQVTKSSPAASSKEFNIANERYHKVPCALCSLPHYLYKCPHFANKSVLGRRQIISDQKLCFNCLKPNHNAEQCFSAIRCREGSCGKRHHTLLHQIPYSEKTEVINKKIQTSTAKVYFQIIPVHVYGPNGRVIKTHALLDSASDVTLVHKDLADDLGLRGCKKRLKVKTYNGTTSEDSVKVSFDIKSSDDPDASRIHVREAWTVDSKAFYCLPQTISPEWKHIHHLNILDVHPTQVNMLIGLDVPQAHLQVEVIHGQDNQPIAVKTPLGWSLMGLTDTHSDSSLEAQAQIKFTLTQRQDLDAQIEQFWKTESFGVVHDKAQPFSVEDQRAQNILDTSTQLVKGHYQIPMLWRSSITSMPNNYVVAEKRFRLLAKRLSRDDDFNALYSKTLNGYVANNQAEKYQESSTDNRTVSDWTRTWYLPHHGVTSSNKPGKVRVVFDAAATYMGTSLNDMLMTGPDLVNSLFGILQRFRLYEVALTADIEGMFHQVTVPECDSKSLQFLWKEDVKQPGPPDVYRMTVHIFGAADSSCCANYAVKRTAKDNAAYFDESVVKTVLQDFYVDDLLKSVQTESEAVCLSQDVTKLMQLGGFRLHKWLSNSSSVLAAIPESERAVAAKDLDLNELPTQRALGLQWNVGTDCFTFNVQQRDVPETKRNVISTVSSIFDPCGYLSPYTIRAKCLIQDLWMEKIQWDEELPCDTQKRWTSWLTELNDLSQFSLPRHHPRFSLDTSWNEVHIFADASERCFGACAYIRYLAHKESYENTCSFLAAKTRVAPIKPALSIPRLELQGAVLAVRLWNSLKDELDIPVRQIFFWTDSSTVLQYLSNERRRFKPFVANRIAEIQDSTDLNQWRHVPSEQNPADLCTRGLSAQKLISSKSWLQGPSFLTSRDEAWPAMLASSTTLEHDPEVKVIRTTQVTSYDHLSQKDVLSETRTCMSEVLNPANFSSWQRLCRTTAWILRAARNFLSKLKHLNVKPIKNQSLTVCECHEAMLAWVRDAQLEAFHQEITCLKSGLDIPTKSRLLQLTPFYDGRHLGVGGRLSNAKIPSEAKHQMLLPDQHPVSQLIINDIHERNAHCGQEHIISLVRQRFWPVNVRKLAKRAIRGCQQCRKHLVKPLVPKMADLPLCRVNVPAGVFVHVGVDYFGPMFVKVKRSSVKRWGCLFTCLSTRAVHIEVADSLETDDFILVLRNFIGRRGHPAHIYSDNGTNFHGANNELRTCLRNLEQCALSDFLSTQAIQWHFNPPQSPHFGGAWERLVRSVKTALKAVLKDRCVHESVLRTVLIEVEAVINSRPLTYNSTSPNDFTALTPNHFLLGKANPCSPVDLFHEKELCSRRRWRQTQVLADHVARRWMKEYLPGLTVRQRWKVDSRNISVGDLVLLIDDNKPRGQWDLARVTNIMPGNDGCVRTVQVKTSRGLYIRPATKLCVLEECV